MEWEFLYSLVWLTSSLCFCCDQKARWLCAGDLTLAVLPALRMDRMRSNAHPLLDAGEGRHAQRMPECLLSLLLSCLVEATGRT